MLVKSSGEIFCAPFLDQIFHDDFPVLIWVFAESGGVVCAVFQVDVKETIFMIPRCALPRRRHWGYFVLGGGFLCLS